MDYRGTTLIKKRPPLPRQVMNRVQEQEKKTASDSLKANSVGGSGDTLIPLQKVSKGPPLLFCFFFTLVAGPRRCLSLKLSDLKSMSLKCDSAYSK